MSRAMIYAARLRRIALTCLLAAVVIWTLVAGRNQQPPVPADRKEVIFWHEWGGEDRAVVEEIIDRFNASQEEFFARAVSMPGNNLDMKVFLSVTGGDSPDLVNQDDPIIGDWAWRGALFAIDELATPEEMQQLDKWLYPAALDRGSYNGRIYALCNGLDIRALYYNKTMLDRYQLDPPKTLAELDNIAITIAPPGDGKSPRKFGYLPDPRRLWVWGRVFGGDFYDESTGCVTADSAPIEAALTWMNGYGKRYGAAATAFRSSDQSLPGNFFPLLSDRYAVVLDGQWRVRDIVAFQADQRAKGVPITQFGVCPLPPPPGGLENAGWVNGNFFLVPRGAKNPEGAWALMKFWSGFGGNEAEAAASCVAGGWIPASQRVVDEPAYQQYLIEQPLMATFVELAASTNQQATPMIPGAPYFYHRIMGVGGELMYGTGASDSPHALLEKTTRDIQRHLDGLEGRP